MSSTEIIKSRNKQMTKAIKKILTAGIMLIFAHSLAASEQTELRDHFLAKIDEVIVVVKDKKLTKDKRNSDIIEILTPMFDFELMAKLSLGSGWKTLSDKDKEMFVKLYVERMKKSYSSKIDAYENEKVDVKKIEQPKDNRIALVTDLVSDKESFGIVYKFHKPKEQNSKKDSWLIYDVEILGVSILKTDMAQFKEFLQTKTITELMAVLAEKQ